MKIENTPDAVTVSNPTPVLCPHESHHTSAGKLCHLFCKLQSYNGHYCCPQIYVNDPEGYLLCQLWTELEELKEANGTVQPPDVPLSPVDCLYENNPSSSEILCQVFCEIQSYEGQYCCPKVYVDDPEGNHLCQLWMELEELKQENGTDLAIDFPLSPVDCLYENHPSSGNTLCSLWCEIQTYKGSRCIQCPDKYKMDPERLLICDLWSELEMINFGIISAGSITTLMPTMNVTCVYSDHLMSSDLLCEVWCIIQATKGEMILSN